MRNVGLVKTLTAGAAISAYRIVKFGASDVAALQAAGPNDLSIGVADLGADAADDRIDIIMSGIAAVEYGGNVTRGQPLTSDANGKAVAATNRTYQVSVAGGSAGNITVTGIKTTDVLLSVQRVDLDATAGNIDLDDLTSEFTISAANTINNTGGSATTGDKLLVTYQRADQVIGQAMLSGVSGDIGSVKL